MSRRSSDNVTIWWTLHCGDALGVLRTLPDQSVHCMVTSPPYWGLRDYGTDGQLGWEPTPDAYVKALAAVFAEARRVLRDDGTCWLNLASTYCGGGRGGNPEGSQKQATNRGSLIKTMDWSAASGWKPKDLVPIPWMVAMALRADGWYLRSDVIWSKPCPMPESVRDRPTRAHEYVFLLTKSARYWYDADAIREPVTQAMFDQMRQGYAGAATKDYAGAGVQDPSAVKARIIARKRANAEQMLACGANARTVWTIATEPSGYDHFATMPKALARKCIMAGCPPGGTVLDPFAGAATTGAVALEEGRSFVGVELNPQYHAMARERLANVAPLLATEMSA